MPSRMPCWMISVGVLLAGPGNAAKSEHAPLSRILTATEAYFQIRDDYLAQARKESEAYGIQYKEIQKTQGFAAAQAFAAHQPDTDQPRLHDLEGRLRTIIGPFVREGLGPAGKINLETLAPEIGYGKLDGLNFRSTDGQTTILVTTPALLENWQKTMFRGATGGPGDNTDVLGTPQFYTQAIGFDDYATDLGDITLTKPNAVLKVTAMLATWSQDIVSYPPTTILETVITDDRIYILRQSIKGKMPEAPACSLDFKKRWDQGKEDAADAGYRQCYAKWIRRQPRFRAVIEQAQLLLERVANR